MPRNSEFTRRELIGAAIAIPTIIPSGVLAQPGRRLGANDRIVTAAVGCGGMGSNHILPDAAAVCDVDENRLAAAVKRVKQGTPAAYKDFRRVLERKDIDAVFFGTPDHWHALMTVMACQAGKHVYSEKPTCRTIEEGRAMINAARHNKRVVQIGAQGRSNPNARFACQYVRNGMLGKVSHVEILHPDNPTTTDYPNGQPVPAGLDWDMWVGPSRWHDYHPKYHPANFRWFMGLGGGQIRDRGNHAMSIACWLMNHDGYMGMVRVEAAGDPQVAGMYDVPTNFVVNYRFSDPDWTMTWRQVAQVPKSHGLWGATYQGDKDSLIVIQGDGACETEEKAKRYVPPSGGEVFLQDAPEGTNVTDRHHLNFLDCIRTGRKPATDVEYGAKACYLCILGNMAWKLGRTITFDYATERFVGDAEADRMLSEPMRAPWRI